MVDAAGSFANAQDVETAAMDAREKRDRKVFDERIAMRRKERELRQQALRDAERDQRATALASPETATASPVAELLQAQHAQQRSIQGIRQTPGSAGAFRAGAAARFGQILRGNMQAFSKPIEQTLEEQTGVLQNIRRGIQAATGLGI